MNTTAVIVLGILIWVLVAVPLALFLARMIQLNRSRACTLGASVAPAVDDPALEVIAGFPAEPTRFAGRAKVMAAASSALAPASGRTAVVLHGTTGTGKTTCAVELAYRYQHGFAAVAFWSAPTDPDQADDALRQLAVALDEQLEQHGFSMLTEITTLERLDSVLPTLTTVFAGTGLLLVLDNLDTVLTADGQWRDLRWALLISALTGHHGPSRVILTSRTVPAGLNTDAVLVQPVHALSRDESLWLVGKLPNLREALRSVALARCVLTLTQGHPYLLELADAAAAERPRLAYQLAEIEETVYGEKLTAFLTLGHTKLDAEQLMQTFTTWTTTIAATAPAPARLLLQALCRVEEIDRNATVIDANWPALWLRSNQPGEPPPLDSVVAALVSTALITTDRVDDPVHYRIHPGVADIIRSATPEPVTAAVDAQLAAWWAAVDGGWGIDPQQSGPDTSRFMERAGLAAARYLLRQHDWATASCFLERILIRDRYSPVASLAVTPLLRRIADATGAAKDLVVLGAALRKLDPAEAELLLHRGYDQATTHGDDKLASTTVGELVTLLRDQGKLREALTMADRKIEHTTRAGFGHWTQLSDQGRRLQILNLLGDHEQVLIDMPTLRAQMADLPDQRAHNDRVNPWNVRECILDLCRLSAVAMERWDDALDLNDELAHTQRRRGADPHEIAGTRFNDYLPLRHLNRLTDAEHLLHDCQDTFDTAGDITQLALVYGARAELADARDHPIEAVELQRSSLRYRYINPDPREISTAHHRLANYLSRAAENTAAENPAAGNRAEQRAHRLSAALLHHFTGNTWDLITTLGVLAAELRRDTGGQAAAMLPTTLVELTNLVDADNGIRFGTLVATLFPDPATAEHALTDLLNQARASTEPM